MIKKNKKTQEQVKRKRWNNIALGTGETCKQKYQVEINALLKLDTIQREIGVEEC